MSHLSLNEVVEKLSAEVSYKQLLQTSPDEVVLPSGKMLERIISLCRTILLPGYYGEARISMQSLRFHTGVRIQTLHELLSEQLSAGLCFVTDLSTLDMEEVKRRAAEVSEKFIATLPSLREVLVTDAEAIFTGDPAAPNLSEIIFCYPGFRAVANYRIAHELFRLGVPFIPRMITEMAHSETGIDIHPGAQIGQYFSIDHGTGTVIGETSIIGNHVRLFQGVSLAGARIAANESSEAARLQPRHPVLEDYVTVYSNATLIGRIHIGRGATIGGNVWVTQNVPPGVVVSQMTVSNSDRWLIDGGGI